MKEVYSGIFLIEERRRFGPSDNIYVLAGRDGLIFDAGYGNKSSVKQFLNSFKQIEEIFSQQNLSLKITRIIVSHGHSDHFSGLNEISKKLELKVLLTKPIANIISYKSSLNKSFQANGYEDYLKIRRKFVRKVWNFIRNRGERMVYKRIFGLSYFKNPSEIIEENSEIVINGEPWSIFSSPGHSPDHISLYNKEKGILFSGDNVLNMRSTWLGPPESNMADYLKTIQYYQKLPNLKLILPAHGDIIENPQEILNAISLRMKEREDLILHAINTHSDKGISPKIIMKMAYPKRRSIIHMIGRGWVVITLKMLETQKIIKRKVKKRKILFFPMKN
ncbi:MAG: MBL fold metallo-hydrolase [Promethearchaeota archaeon]|jgi:glyoxylase-like metal-dependent hydrolase (beta-lactamase superfamily II)